MPPKFRLYARVGKNQLLLPLVTVAVFCATVVGAQARQLQRVEPTTTTQTIQISRIYLYGSLPAGMVGTSYSGGLSLRGGIAPYRFSMSGTLPPGVALSTSTGVLF